MQNLSAEFRKSNIFLKCRIIEIYCLDLLIEKRLKDHIQSNKRSGKVNLWLSELVEVDSTIIFS